jgi:hypothetical protein
MKTGWVANTGFVFASMRVAQRAKIQKACNIFLFVAFPAWFGKHKIGMIAVALAQSKSRLTAQHGDWLLSL